MTDVKLHWFIVYFIHTMHNFLMVIMYGVCRMVQGKNYIWELFLCRMFFL
jgi:hypothetical protein